MAIFNSYVKLPEGNYSQGHSIPIAHWKARPPLQVPTSCWKSWPAQVETHSQLPWHSDAPKDYPLSITNIPRTCSYIAILKTCYIFLYSIWMFPKNRAAAPKSTFLVFETTMECFQNFRSPHLPTVDPWPGASSLPPRAVGATRRESGSSGGRGSGVAEGVSPGLRFANTVRTAARAWKVETS